ncbi:MAG: M1 family peptidase [Flavobacteriales bacterium TMED191]|nr:MAG: M1 family peptidase [Flavobacteriales bacterium TMED191]
MKKLFIYFLFLLGHNLYAQQYFQQETNFNIQVELNDSKHTLSGFEKIEYTNNSNDTLKKIWFHIWPNAYKNANTAFAKQKLENGNTEFYYSADSERGYIDSLDFKVNGDKVIWEYHYKHIDICKIILNNPLPPKQTITISTPFFVKIPNAKFSRLGHVGQSYMITQWYPKPAVYDQDGWHIMPYLDQGEFYSEFGSFDVKITLPDNYIVGSSGHLQNPSEINFLNNLAKKTSNLISFKNDMSFPKSSSKTKTLYYKQENIHDFAWFADKRFHVLKGELNLPNSSRKVTLWSMFTNNEAPLWTKSIEYLHDAIYYYSEKIGNYPYQQCTAIDGTISAGGGMEYPAITVIGESKKEKLLENVIVHEVGHNWFYGILANNERLYPWMDEGINSYYEMRYMHKKYPNYNMILDPFSDKMKKVFNLNGYSFNETSSQIILQQSQLDPEQPIELSSEKYTSTNYGNMVYIKSAIVLNHLQSYLGENLYDICMQDYFDKWKFKHPSPKNLKNIFEQNTGLNLDWFFDEVIKTNKTIDYAISNIKTYNQNLLITIKNKGKIATPFTISGIKNKKIKNTIWIEGFNGLNKINYKNENYDYIQIDAQKDLYETNRNNNTIRTTGFLKKLEPLQLQLIGSLYDSQKTQVFFRPNYNLNYYDKLLIGLKFYNEFMPKSGFSYSLNPMYGIGSKNLAGNGNFSYVQDNPQKYFRQLELGVNFEQYSYGTIVFNNNEGESAQKNRLFYKKIEPFVELNFKKNNARSTKSSFIRGSLVYINKLSFYSENLLFTKSQYFFSNQKTLNPYSFNFSLESGKEFYKFNLNTNHKYNINDKYHVDMRGYFGLIKTENPAYNLQLSSWVGINDYMFDNSFIGRSETSGLWRNQIVQNEGGLKHITGLSSDLFLGSINVEFVYSKLFRLYLEGGYNGSMFGYGTGLVVTLLKDKFNIYLPLYTESGLAQFDNLNFITYSINLNIEDFF